MKKETKEYLLIYKRTIINPYYYPTVIIVGLYQKFLFYNKLVENGPARIGFDLVLFSDNATQLLGDVNLLFTIIDIYCHHNLCLTFIPIN